MLPATERADGTIRVGFLLEALLMAHCWLKIGPDGSSHLRKFAEHRVLDIVIVAIVALFTARLGLLLLKPQSPLQPRSPTGAFGALQIRSLVYPNSTISSPTTPATPAVQSRLVGRFPQSWEFPRVK